MSESMPKDAPPEEAMTLNGGEAMPSAEVLAAAEGIAFEGELSEPSLGDDAGFAAEENASAGGAWHVNKKITHLWSINQNRNSWVAVSGLGWKRLSPASDSINTTLTMLAAHAKQGNRTVKLREESALIVELYVW